MRRSPRVRNRGPLQKAVSSLRLLARASVIGLTRHGILVSQEARVHIFGARPNLHCRQGAIAAIIVNSFLGRMPALHGGICKCGPNFTKRAFKCHAWETPIPSRITSKRNTNLPRNSSPRFVGTNK